MSTKFLFVKGKNIKRLPIDNNNQRRIKQTMVSWLISRLNNQLIYPTRKYLTKNDPGKESIKQKS